MNQPAASTRQLMKRALGAIQKSRAAEAMVFLQQVLAINPDHAEALYNIGYIYHSTGQYMQAFDVYQRSIHADPNYIDSYLMLCKLLEAQNRGEEAIQLAERATHVAPDDARTHGELVTMLMRFNQAHMVPAYLEQVMPRLPKATNLLQIYCMALKVNERHEEADVAYRKLLAEHRVPPSARLLYEIYLPRLNRSAEQIEKTRAAFRASLEQFIIEKPRVQVQQITYLPVFQLAFHNHDNKDLTRLFTKMLRTVAPELNYVAPHCKAALRAPNEKIRIGFLSGNMHHHSVGNCYRSMMINLAQQADLDVKFFNLSNVVDDKIDEIFRAGVPIISLPKMLESIREVVAAHTLDILIYPDIGMDAITHYLALGRMARYQCVLHGHPETTGIDTIDYFISYRPYEPKNAQENYTEQVLCSPGMDTTFKRPKAPERVLTREELGLPVDKKLYVCPMTIQKFHPDFDHVMADILARDPNAVIVLFNDFQQQSASTLMQQRIMAVCDPARLIFMPWLTMDGLYSVLKTADAVLETIYFGGGTTLQFALGHGIPIVGTFGTYVRSRLLGTYYRMMGIENPPVATDVAGYAELAVRLANDTAYHQALSEEILAKNHLLFDAQLDTTSMPQLMRDIMAQNLESYRP